MPTQYPNDDFDIRHCSKEYFGFGDILTAPVRIVLHIAASTMDHFNLNIFATGMSYSYVYTFSLYRNVQLFWFRWVSPSLYKSESKTLDAIKRKLKFLNFCCGTFRTQGNNACLYKVTFTSYQRTIACGDLLHMYNFALGTVNLEQICTCFTFKLVHCLLCNKCMHTRIFQLDPEHFFMSIWVVARPNNFVQLHFFIL